MKTAFGYRTLLGVAVPVVAGLALAACSNFLEDAAAPKGTLNEQTLANVAGVEGSLIAAYRDLDWNNGVGGGWGYAASNWVWGSVASDDAYKGSDAGDQPPINDIEAYKWNNADGQSYINDMWRGVYEGVVRSNATLRLLDQVQKASPGALTDAQAKGIGGEALFLRAHYHFNAFRMWVSIPYYTTEDTDIRKTQDDSATVVNKIIKDLDSASTLLAANFKSGPRNGQKGRAFYWTVQAYKGRVLMYAGQYDKAQTVLRDVRANGPFRLEQSFDRVWTGFSDFANGPETILAFQASVNDGEPNGNNSNYGERLNLPYSGSPFGCCGFHQPSQNLVNFFQVDATTGLPLGSANDASEAWNASDVNRSATNTAATTWDPRLDWTVGRDGVPYKDWGMYSAVGGWVRDLTNGGPYSPKKNAQEKASGNVSTVGWAPAQENGVNIHIFRYADALLMLAEADVERGDLVEACSIVNEVRTRAGAKAQGPGTSAADLAVAIDDPRITWAKYKVGLYACPFASPAAARTAVRNERRLELAMEGQRFFDLKRWGVLATTLNAYVLKEKTRRPYLGSAATVTASHNRYPIPNLQIELSKVGGESRLTQNPGW